MNQTVTLQQVETLAEQLPLQDQLKLMSRISDHLSQQIPALSAAQATPESVLGNRLQLAEQLLAEVAEVEDDAEGEFDATETLRVLRAERAN